VTSARKHFFVLLFFVLFLISCSKRASELPDYGTVPPFSMTMSTGEPFDGSALGGKVWIADFIYTNCPAECPMMTSRMHSLQKRVSGQQDVRLVSISVDPARDTPAALTAFAHRYGAPTPQWIFLTGSPATVHQLAYTTFHVGDVLGKISHSTKFVLVDKHGHLRGYYSSFDQEGIPTLLKDLEALRKEPA
jgi:protein SCO1